MSDTNATEPEPPARDPLIEELSGAAAKGGLIVTSPTVTKLFSSMARAQLEYEAATKDNTNTHFGSHYATLASGLAAVRAALNRNGIAIMQATDASGMNQVSVETLLTHESGEWASSVMRIPAAKFDPQGVGSASTYARRYSLFAMCGIAPEDDDGNAAQGPRDQGYQQRPPAAPRPAQGSAPAQRQAPAIDRGRTPDSARETGPSAEDDGGSYLERDESPGPVTQGQRSEIVQHQKRLGWNPVRLSTEYTRAVGQGSLINGMDSETAAIFLAVLRTAK